MSPARTGRNELVLLATVFTVALGVRLLSVAAATEGGLRLGSPDAYAHLRRATAITRSFPAVTVRDPWLNHPDGGVFIWPPAFDLLGGGISRLAFGADATRDEVARVLAVLPPLLGALHVVPLFFLARRVLSRRRALLAACAYSVLPVAAVWSQFGHADQHVAETLLLLLLLLALARTRVAGERRASFGRAFAAGAALAAMVLTWQGAVFAGVLSFAWAAFALRPSVAVTFAVSSAGLTALGTLPYASGLELPFTFVSFGWFQPALLLAGASAVAAIAAARSRGIARRACAGLGFLLLAATAPVAPDLARGLFGGARYVVSHTAGVARDEMARGGYLSYPKDWIGLIAESRPLLRPPFLATLRNAVEESSPGIVLLPVAVALWVRRRPDRRLLGLFGAVLLLMTLSQQRNGYYLAPFAALALAEALARFAPRGVMRPRPAAVAAASLLVVLPGLPHYGRIVTYAGAPGTDLVETLERLGSLYPPPFDAAGHTVPEPGSAAGVFCPWSAGHFVTALSGYPAAADPFGYGFRRQARLYTTPDDAEAARILREARCAWLFTTDLRAVLPAYAAAAGRPPTPLAATFAVRVHESASPRPLPFLELAIDSRTAYRAPDGRVVPRFRVFRVRTATEAAEGSSRAPDAP
ncbi:MAG TPA: STT3 domain-containing protein [Thermoanaerobaculia bacterium]|nr:STT3 domain-containing protein [Thermoanaerobaculia bacterium]HPA52466.1 STT3 domain-containing protein [Thermoanaerobaculia bacterium]HQP87409.1 STT3 domain-containing protein [Thermoanaerobaculia bacterium]